MAKDIKRSELMGLPIVGILLIIVFGGVLAALLPLLVGGLSIIGSTGILTLISMTTEVNAFAQSCVTL
ncbi:MMPL family transporter, partial [Streptomyces sp. UMAF16]|nr:MMPL family transporter [Streptomyces sp. UMAF16]